MPSGSCLPCDYNVHRHCCLCRLLSTGTPNNMNPERFVSAAMRRQDCQQEGLSWALKHFETTVRHNGPRIRAMDRSRLRSRALKQELHRNAPLKTKYADGRLHTRRTVSSKDNMKQTGPVDQQDLLSYCCCCSYSYSSYSYSYYYYLLLLLLPTALRELPLVSSEEPL